MSEDLFEKCVKRVGKKDSFLIKCRLGFWSVEGPSKESVEWDARHYFHQYYDDGEYFAYLEKSN